MYKSNLVKQYDTPPAGGNPRATEAWAFLQAALRMREAKESGDRTAMLGAARLNWQLWTIIQADLLAPDCPVPLEIRNNMLSLAAFVDKHTLAFLARPVAEDMDILISIDREISGGLYTNPEQPQQAAPTVPLGAGVTA